MNQSRQWNQRRQGQTIIWKLVTLSANTAAISKMAHKISETNSSFYVEQRTTGKL